jgi:UDP-N-acetylmuramate--alanine ligase
MDIQKINFDNPCSVYFMGIGGISMSGLAEILHQAGFIVSGSDMQENDSVKKLQAMGIKINIGQTAANIGDGSGIDLAVYTAAIHPDNDEFLAIQAAGIPLLKRAELLGQLMDQYKYSVAVAGTHGKTTTTSMLSHIFLKADTDPTISIGGMLEAIGGNIRVGHSDFFVTEACEYTNSYHAFKPYVSIILNIDNDHLDFFKNLDNIIESFTVFATKTREGGALVVNGDMPYVEKIRERISGRDIKLITFGTGEGNNYRADNIHLNELGQPTYTLIREGKENREITLSVTGVHNAVNSLSAIAAAEYVGVDFDAISEGLRLCHSADRRFQYKGTLEGNVKIIDDYAHHPTEVAATLAVANSVKEGDLWVAFQPHTYSRTKALLTQFADVLSVADHVLLADIYAAREPFDETISSKNIADLLIEKGCDAVYLGNFDAIKKYFLENYKNNDMLITMGAGNIDSVGNDLLSK